MFEINSPHLWLVCTIFQSNKKQRRIPFTFLPTRRQHTMTTVSPIPDGPEHRIVFIGRFFPFRMRLNFVRAVGVDWRLEIRHSSGNRIGAGSFYLGMVSHPDFQGSGSRWRIQIECRYCGSVVLQCPLIRLERPIDPYEGGLFDWEQAPLWC